MGFPRSACASSDRGGRPLDPEASGVHTTGENCPAAACRSSTARPCTPVLIPSAGALGNEASAGVHSRSPVRSSPGLRSRMERERFGFFPELRTPRLPATRVRTGTGLEHWPGATSPTSSSVLQSTSPLAACDLVSHVLSPVITHEQPHQPSRSQHRNESAASGRTISDLIEQCSPARGHDIPAAINSPGHRQGHDLTEGLQGPGEESAHPPAATRHRVCRIGNPVTPIRRSSPARGAGRRCEACSNANRRGASTAPLPGGSRLLGDQDSNTTADQRSVHGDANANRDCGHS
jgi:hypothetical protein